MKSRWLVETDALLVFGCRGNANLIIGGSDVKIQVCLYPMHWTETVSILCNAPNFFSNSLISLYWHV